MTVNADMDRLLELATQARETAAIVEFSRYCEYRGRGVRPLAMRALNTFLDVAVVWPFDERLSFARWALLESRRFLDENALLPQPLRTRLIEPVVREWRMASPDDAEPHMWLGLLRCDNPSLHLDRAIELDPGCELARQTLIQWILNDIEYHQHELPTYYLHDPREDLSDLRKALRLCSRGNAEDGAQNARRKISELRTRIKAWLRNHPQKGDFATP